MAQPPFPPPRPDQAAEMLIPVNVTPLALIAGYVGLFSVLCFPAPISLLVGIAALQNLKKHPDKIGHNRAWFAIIMGAVGTLALAAALIGRLSGA
jgi:sugar phosphate permease